MLKLRKCIEKIYAHFEFDANNKKVKKGGTGACLPLSCITSSFNNNL